MNTSSLRAFKLHLKMDSLVRLQVVMAHPGESDGFYCSLKIKISILTIHIVVPLRHVER
jgi:hypothetical protein